MSSSLKELCEKYINKNSRGKDETEEDKKIKRPRLLIPKWFKFHQERGLINFIAIGASFALLVRKFEYYSTIFNFRLFKKAVKKYPGSFMPIMTQREAKLILNLTENANAKQIRQAHIKLMLLNHPDSGGSTYLASKINEAKDILSSEVEEEKKEATDLHEDDNSEIMEILQEIPGERESERLILSVLYGFKEEYTPEEIENLKKKLLEIIAREKAEEKANPKHSEYEFKNLKIEDSPLFEEPGRFVDKNSEFYQKYKDKIENGDYFDPLDDMNTERSRLTKKDDEFKI